jgi:hypothetical protein
VVLEVYDHMRALVQHLASGVQLLAEVVSPVLSLTEVVVRDLKLTVLVLRWRCTTTEDGIWTPQLHDVLPQ